jgi:hypothetical protein
MNLQSEYLEGVCFCFDCFIMILTSTGVPNTLNVMTNFPFLVVGVLGFVFALDGSFFNIRF